MNRTLTLGVVALLGLGACTGDDRELTTLHQVEALRLTSPVVGQQARYQRITLPAGDTTATIHADTLIVEVTEVSAGSFAVEEYLSSHSHSALSANPAVAFPAQIFSYRLSPKPAVLAVTAAEAQSLRSRLFQRIDGALPTLSYALTSTERVELEGDRLRVDYLPTDRANPVADTDLVAVLNHAGRQHGLPGLTHLHSRQLGLILMLTEHDLAGNASGWRLIE